MNKFETMEKLLESGIVAIVRTETAEKAKKTVDAIVAGGIKTIEVTMSVPGALDIIKEMSAECKKDGVILGAGSVLDPETARAAILAGAEFIVSPNLNKEVVRLCNRYQIPSMPGVMSVNEAIEAMELGADIIKVFPAELFGPKVVKAFRAPLPQAPLMPTGGVSLDNVEEWFKAGAVALGVGGSLSKGAKTDDYELVTNTAKAFVEKIKAARASK